MSAKSSYRSSPAFFNQGPTAFLRLVIAAALSVTLMLGDQRWDFATPVRNTVATLLYPVQWALLQPVHWLRSLGDDLGELRQAQALAQRLTQENLELNRSNQTAQYLALENRQLRALLDLQPQITSRTRATEVLYRVSDPYSQTVMIAHGAAAGVKSGDAVIDRNGVWGQVTQAYPFSAEVRLISSPQQNTPVINARSGAAGVVVGSSLQRGALELRYIPTRADLEVGDVLVTSGLDGVYPPGYPVATITRIERGAQNYFDLILAQPIGDVRSSRHLLVVHSDQTSASGATEGSADTTTGASPVSGSGSKP